MPVHALIVCSILLLVIFFMAGWVKLMFWDWRKERGLD